MGSIVHDAKAAEYYYLDRNKRWQAAKGGEHVHHTQHLPEDQATLTQELEARSYPLQDIQQQS